MRSLLASLWLAAACTPWATGAEIAWVSDFKAAQARAKKSGKLIMIEFHNPAIGSSERLHRITWKDPRVISAISAGVVPLQVHAEKEGKELSGKYRVVGLPAIIFVDSGGVEAARLGGPLAPLQFLDELKKVLAMHSAFPGIQAALKKNPRSGEANCKMAWALAIRQKRTDAERHLANAKKAGYKGPYLAKACNMIGDLFQSSSEFEAAIAYFKRAESASMSVADKSYALVSVVSCQWSLGKVDEAKATARRLIALKGATPEYVEFAKNILALDRPRRGPPP